MSEDAVGPVLLARGVAGVLGVAAAGLLVDRRPTAALSIPVACQAVALIGLFVLGRSAIVTIGLVALTGFAFAAFTAALGGRVMEMAPGSVDVASGTISTAVNIGISAGALGGGLLLASNGARSTVLVAGVLSTAALALALGEKNGSSGDRLPAFRLGKPKVMRTRGAKRGSHCATNGSAAGHAVVHPG
jgi:DHA1 family inner membrane transport protein